MKKNSSYFISRAFYGLAAVAFIGVITGHTWHLATFFVLALFGVLMDAVWKEEANEDL